MAKTIRIEDQTHAELSTFGNLSESFDSVIKKLMDHWKKTHK